MWEWKRTEIRYIITRTSIILNWASPVWRNLYTSLRHRSCSLPVRGRGIFWRSQGSLATTLPFGISIYPTTRRSHHFFWLEKVVCGFKPCPKCEYQNRIADCFCDGRIWMTVFTLSKSRRNVCRGSTQHNLSVWSKMNCAVEDITAHIALHKQLPCIALY